MIKKLQRLIFELRVLLAGEYTRAKVYEKYLGVKFGKNVRMTGVPFFSSEPYLISIGDNVTITQHVTFHTHDGGVGLLRQKHPGIELIAPITIGNNVFIGSHTIILPGITVGNNVIIGSSSVITKNIPDNVVVAGVPARIIKTMDEYEEKSLANCDYTNKLSPEEKKNFYLKKFRS
ncbi:acyltransferase [Mucilaginibacter psychrotolerans]|uniref:Acetyltransferase n=1 Tax=Mucilaginibacter psychrotolerans TaxID=1524096 RepID=A0A4Y8SIS6_9SPHI|nr:acyltransferase [Mucilaginibacter psychrotolerans]TFF38792.1 acyltransferase [Mucilaginibacter psychrotolerans]